MIDLQGPVQPGGGGGERLWENLLGLKMFKRDYDIFL
jgi:hypothetical protein